MNAPHREGGSSRVAAVCGATTPLGWALSDRLGAEGFDLALIDDDAAALATLRARLASNRRVVTVHEADPGDPSALAAAADAVITAHGRVDLLLAATGQTLDAPFERLPETAVQRAVARIAQAPITLTRALLPALRKTGAGRVVLFPGRAALVASAGGAVETAARYALRGFAAGLTNELDLFGGAGVTSVYADADASPDAVAAAALAATRRGRVRALVGRRTRLGSWLERLAPARGNPRARAGTMVLAGRTAVVTGAGSGIGRGIARALVARGCHVALADRNEAGLDETAAALRALGGSLRITTHVLDVTDPVAQRGLRDSVQAAHGGADLLFNNAGVALGGDFLSVSAAEFDWLMAINFTAMIDLTRVFLPMLRQATEARLVYTSSLFGLIAPPGQVAYSTSKFGIRGFANALSHELSDSAVGISVVHPGGVRTAIARNARIADVLKDDPKVQRERASMDRMLRLDPDRAGEIIVAGTRARRPRILVGTDARILSAVERLAPASYWRILGPLLGKLTGRTIS